MKNRYIDIPTNFNIHPATGDLITLKDTAAITSQIRNLLYTAVYEAQWDPTLGAGIPQTLFDNFSSDTNDFIRGIIIQTLNKYVDRATLKDVVVNYDGDHSYTATVVYTPINTFEDITINLIFARTR